VHVPAVTRTVARQVVVRPGGRTPVVHPAVYRDVPRPVVLREASVRSVVIPAEQRLVERTVVVRPAAQHVIEHPPVLSTKRDRVLARHGGYAWQRVH
jgi:hypothetical protein